LVSSQPVCVELLHGRQRLVTRGDPSSQASTFGKVDFRHSRNRAPAAATSVSSNAIA
jgi:hypothetical protein